MEVTEPSLWRHSDFIKLWTGQTVSELRSVVTRTALPLAAMITLDGTAFQVGVLVASGSTAVLLVGLFAGALVDRSRRRPLMIGANAIRAVLLLSIPAAAIAGGLRIEQLYIVAFIEAALGSIFDVAYRTYLPSLLPPHRLLEGNAKIGMTGAIAEIGGPGFAGALVQLITAPMAMLVDAVSYAVSAITILAIRTPERVVERVEGPAGLRRQLAEGFGAVAGHVLLRPMALASVTRRALWELLRVALARCGRLGWRGRTRRGRGRPTAHAPPWLRADDRLDERCERGPRPADPRSREGRRWSPLPSCSSRSSLAMG